MEEGSGYLPSIDGACAGGKCRVAKFYRLKDFATLERKSQAGVWTILEEVCHGQETDLHGLRRYFAYSEWCGLGRPHANHKRKGYSSACPS